jgi:putative hydrolase of the HAD superfamily
VKRIRSIIFDWDDTLYDTHSDLGSVPGPIPGSTEALEILHEKYILYLVTLGTPEMQKQKVLDTGYEKYFSHIFYVNINETHSNWDTFKIILEGLLSQGEISRTDEVISVGNRIDSDIRWAKSLGMKAVQFEFGDYKQLLPEGEDDIPDLKIKNMMDLIKWLGVNE